MRLPHRLRLLAVLAGMSLLLTACPEDAPEVDELVDDPDDEEAVEEEEVSLRFAHVYELTAPTYEYGADVLPNKVAEADVGLEVTVFPAAQLGSEAEIVEQVAAGQLEMAIAGPSFLGTWHEPIGVFDAAHLFEDRDHLLEVATGDIGQQLWEELREDRGIRVLDTWYYGARHITANQPVSQPDDLQGFRLRMPDAEVWLESGRALGANPTPVEFAEVYIALQQGVVDGQENPIPTILAMGFHEVQDYINLTAHIQSSTQKLIAEGVWEQLSERQQEALLEAVQEAGEDVARCIEEGDEAIIDEWRETGELEVNEDIDVDASPSAPRSTSRTASCSATCTCRSPNATTRP